jgi:hypothetical protein
MVNRTKEQQKEYLKNNPEIYQKQLEKQKIRYQNKKIKDLFLWLSI